jgi:ABC-2 type transport system permease protein
VSAFLRELRLLLRSRAVIVTVAMLLLVTCAAVANGVLVVQRQWQDIHAVRALQAADEQAVARHAHDAGDAAYYTHHVAWQPPSTLAFTALAPRDVAPTQLRIRALALEAQRHETEAFNPELVAGGAFDLAFVVTYLAPLVVIALLHDLFAAERSAGRLLLLQATPFAWRRLWWPRIGSRMALVLAALLLPLAGGVLASGTALADALAVGLLVVAAVVFWTVLALAVVTRAQRAATAAATLVGLWFALTLVLPSATNLVVNAAVPVPAGAEIARANREAVHDGWDLPRAATLERFVALHPEWAAHTRMSTPFHWKWYFAFQHLGDVAVAELASAHHAGIAEREAWAQRAAWLLPPIAVHRAMHARAGTDVRAQLAFQVRVRAFHDRLRAFYYPYLFLDRPFGREDFARAPRFDSTTAEPAVANGREQP